VKAGAVAGNCARTSSVAGRHSAVKSQPRKLKGPGALTHSRPVPFQQRTNTSCYLAIPTRGFTAAVSVFGGTPPVKPLNCNCKIRFVLLCAAIFRSWAHHAGDDSMLVLVKFMLSLEDIIKMSRYSCSQIVRSLFIAIHPVSSAGKIKNPAYTR
jgi:hypothetical protein